MACADDGSQQAWDTASTVTGLTGMIRVPNAIVLRDDRARLTWTPPMRNWDPSIGARSSFALGIGLTPRSEIAITLGPASHDFDLEGHAKLQILSASGLMPSVAIGTTDVARNGPRGSTGFVVASWPLLGDQALVTLGGAFGGNKGLLGGVQYRIGPIFELQAEYDTLRFNVGAVARLGDRVFARVADLSTGTTFSLGYSGPLSYLGARPLVQAGQSRNDAAVDAMERIKAALASSGLEDVQVTVTHMGEGRELAVAYEDRCYTINQLDGLPEVLRTMAENAPESTTALAVMLRRRGLVMAEYRIPLESYRQYTEGRMPAREFAKSAEITALPKTSEMRGPQQATDIANPSFGHTDIVISPGVRNVIGTEVGAFRIGVLGRVEAVTQLGRGLQAQMRGVYPIGGELVAEEPRRWKTDRWLISYAFVPRPGWLAQIIAGRFPGSNDGVVLEALHPIARQIVGRAIVGKIDNDRLGKRLYALGEVWYLIPQWKAQVRLVGGRFLSRDTGIGIDLIRSFGSVDVGIGVRDTSTSRLVELRLSAPLSPRKQPQAPGRYRVRLADYYEHSLRSVIEGVNYLYLESVTARELSLGPDLRDTFLSRYRLLPDSGWWPGQ
jgi:hypothetical protein